MSRLDDVDLTLHLGKKEYKKQLAAAQERLVHLRLLLGGQIGPKELGPPLCVLFEGWDASGKGGAIQRLVSELDPRHVRVRAVRGPHLRREAAPLPVAVLAEAAGLGRHGRAGPQLVRAGAGRAGRGLRDRGGLAAGLLARSSTSRRRSPPRARSWSSSGCTCRRRSSSAGSRSAGTTRTRRGSSPDEDWRNRKKRAEYEAAVEDMLARTDHPAGPWHVVAADDKRWARVDVVRTVCRGDGAGLADARHRPRPAAREG